MLEDRKLETFSKSYAIIIYNRFYNLIIRQEEPWLGDVARMLEDSKFETFLKSYATIIKGDFIISYNTVGGAVAGGRGAHAGGQRPAGPRRRRRRPQVGRA